jgi:hypothetical protein
MPRTAIAVTNIAQSLGTPAAAGTAVDVANGMYVDVGGRTNRLLLLLRNTAGAAKLLMSFRTAKRLVPAFTVSATWRSACRPEVRGY